MTHPVCRKVCQSGVAHLEIRLMAHYIEVVPNRGESIMPILIIYIIVFLAIFLITREFWCWYYKSSDIKAQLEEVSRRLAEIENKLNNR